MEAAKASDSIDILVIQIGNKRAAQFKAQNASKCKLVTADKWGEIEGGLR